MTAGTVAYLPTATPAHTALNRLTATDLHADDAATIRRGLDQLHRLPHPAVRQPVKNAITTLARVRADIRGHQLDYTRIRRELVPDADLWSRITEAVDVLAVATDDWETFRDNYCDSGRETDALGLREEWESALTLLLARAVCRRG